MNNKELLKTHPKTTEVLVKWFTEKMIESFDDNSPKEFQEYMKQQGVSEEKLATLNSY